MGLTEFAQKRPIVIYIFAIFIVVLGLFAYFDMPMMLLPEIKVPGAVIQTEVSGGTARQIDNAVTSPLLKKLHSLSHVNELFGSSYPGISLITIEFDIGTNALQAFQNVESRVNEVQNNLPKAAQPPEVTQLNLTNIPIMTLALESKSLSVMQLTTYANDSIIKKLDLLKGVQGVSISGGINRVVNVHLDPEKMTAYGINIQDIGAAFQGENVEFPGYFVDTLDKTFLLNLNEKFHSINQIRNLIINTHKGNVVKLDQVGQIGFGEESSRGAVRFNNQPAIGLVVSKDPGENAIAIINKVKNYLNDTIIPKLPAGMKLSVAHDNAAAITRNVNGLEMTVVYAILFASLIVYLFIRSFRSLFIIVIAIPISVLMGILVIRLTGGTFNIITLLSLVLLVGLVVDDAIVVTENIHRVRLAHPELTHSQGVTKAARQVRFSVLASTITLLAIFSSSVVMSSDIAVIFEAFSVSILAGVTTSYFVSMTLTPVLAQHLMIVKEHENPFYTFLRKIIDAYVFAYKGCLKYVLKFRWLVMLLTVVYILPVFFSLQSMGSGFFPQGADHGQLKINIRGTPNANLNYMLQVLDQIHTNIKDNPYIANSYAQIGPIESNTGTVILMLKPYSETHMQSETIRAEITKKLADIPGVVLNVIPVPVSPTFDQPLMFNVVDTNYHRLMQHMVEFARDLHDVPNLGSLTTNLQPEQMQYELQVNRALANNRDISTKDILESVALFGGHIKVGSFIPNANHPQQYDIFLEPKRNSLINPGDLNKIYLFGKNGTAIQLSTVASLHKVILPSVIHRTGLKFSVQFAGTPLVPVNYAFREIHKIASKYFSPTTEILPTGQSKASGTAMRSTVLGLGFSFLILYFVLTIQFESFLQPLVVLAAEPLALVGAVYALEMFGMTLNIFSLIGILLLMGLVAKNAILLVTRANQYRSEGETIDQALLKACPERLVPITMTSLTIVLAMLPVFMQSGVGAKNQIVMSTTIVAGIVASTVLSVIFVPALYHILEALKYRFKKPTDPNSGATNVQA